MERVLIFLIMAISALLGSALVGAAGSLGSSLLNYFGTKETNRTNAGIAADTNQANLYLYNKQVENQYSHQSGQDLLCAPGLHTDYQDEMFRPLERT